MSLLSRIPEAVGFQVMFYGGLVLGSLVIATIVWLVSRH